MGVTFTNNLPSIANLIEREVERIVAETAFNVEAKTKAAAPVLSGLLRNSYQTEIEPSGKTATVGTVVEYAAINEYGGAHHPAQPHLTPAAESERDDFESKLKNLESGLR